MEADAALLKKIRAVPIYQDGSYQDPEMDNAMSSEVGEQSADPSQPSQVPSIDSSLAAPYLIRAPMERSDSGLAPMPQSPWTGHRAASVPANAPMQSFDSEPATPYLKSPRMQGFDAVSAAPQLSVDTDQMTASQRLRRFHSARGDIGGMFAQDTWCQYASRLIFGARMKEDSDMAPEDFDDFIDQEMAHLKQQQIRLRKRLIELKDSDRFLDFNQCRAVLRGEDAGMHYVGFLGRLYHGLLWMRFPLAFLACALFAFALVLGRLVNFSFITVLHGGDKVQADIELQFSALPLSFMFAAVLVNQCLILFFDSIGATPLVHWRSTVMACFFCSGPANPPTPRLCLAVDAGLLLWLELYPLGRMIYNDIGLQAGYSLGIVEASFALALLLILADFIIAVRNLQWTRVVQHTNLQPNVRWLQQVMTTHRMNPSFHTGMYCKNAAFQVVQPLSEVVASTSTDPIFGRKKIRRIRKTCFCIAALAWIVLCVFTFHLNKEVDISVVSTTLSVCVLVMSFTLRKLLKTQMMGESFLIVCSILGFASIILMNGATWGQYVNEIERGPLMFVEGFGLQGDLVKTWTNDKNVQHYPVCDIKWGGKGSMLSTLDLAGISYAAYGRKCWNSDPDPKTGGAMSVEEIIRQSFGEGPQLRFCNEYSKWPPRSIVVYFPSTEVNQKGTWVVGVKGTSSLQDIYSDVYVYATVEVLQSISKNIMPLLSLFPLYLIQSVMTWPLLGSVEQKETLWMPLLKDLEDLPNWIRSTGEQNSTGVRKGGVAGDPQKWSADDHRWNDPMVMTGHSLGGALGVVAASRAGAEALVFSAPGNTLMADVFKMNVQSAKKYVNVMPDHDVIPKVDEHYGVVQHILCRTKDGQEASSFLCHQVKKTACELWRVCGDEKKRDWSGNCGPFIGNELLGKNFQEL